MVELAIIGAGIMGRSLAEATRESVRYICDPAKDVGQVLAEDVGAQWLADPAEAITDSHVDAVVVAVPPRFHLSLVEQSLRAGKHVLCEKPLALTTDECDQIIAVASECDRLLMVGHILRFNAHCNRMIELARSGAIGDIRAVIVQRTTGSWPYGHGWRNAREQHGGLYYEVGAHEIDVVLQLLDGPQRVAAHCSGLHESGMENFTSALVTFAGGRYANLQYGIGDPFGAYTVDVYGERGALRLESMSKLFMRNDSGEEAEQVAVEDDGQTHAQREMRAFCDAVASGGPSPVPAEAGRAATALASAIVRSYESNEVVTL